MATSCVRLILDGSATAAHDLSDGGLLVALAEMAMASGIGAKLDAAPDDIPGACLLVRRGPPQARYLITVAGGEGAGRASIAPAPRACWFRALGQPAATR